MTPHLGQTGHSGHRASINHFVAVASVGYRRMNVSSFMQQTTEQTPNMQQVDRSGQAYPPALQSRNDIGRLRDPPLTLFPS